MMFMPMFSPTVVTAGGVTMVAEQKDTATGYSDGSFGPPLGSISGEPLQGFTLTILSSDPPSALLLFFGDAVSALSGKSLYVDDIEYVLDDAILPPTYDTFAPEHTAVLWELDNGPEGPIFVDGHSYNIRIE